MFPGSKLNNALKVLAVAFPTLAASTSASGDDLQVAQKAIMGAYYGQFHDDRRAAASAIDAKIRDIVAELKRLERYKRGEEVGLFTVGNLKIDNKFEKEFYKLHQSKSVELYVDWLRTRLESLTNRKEKLSNFYPEKYTLYKIHSVSENAQKLLQSGDVTTDDIQNFLKGLTKRTVHR